MNTHVFVVDATTFKLHLQYLFAGTGAKDIETKFLLDVNFTMHWSTERNLTGMIADVSRIRKGDNIIFYLQAEDNKPGRFFGVFKAESKCFFDENDVNNYLKNRLKKGLSYRIKIEPYEVFEKGITEHEYLDSLDGKDKISQMCWSLIYRKLKGNRGCTMIMPYEYEDLYNKLLLKNDGKTLVAKSYTYSDALSKIVEDNNTYNYSGRMLSINITPRLLRKAGRNNAFETHLQAYIMQNFDEEPLKTLFGIHNSQCWVGNEVSCGVGMQRIDVMFIEESADVVNIKVVELKDELPYVEIIDNQLPWYIEWVMYYVVPNYESKNKTIHVTPYIVAKKTQSRVFIDKVKKSTIKCMVSTKAIVEPTRYIGFTIEKDLIAFESIV